MKVTMIVKLSGSRDGQDWPDVGEDLDVPNDEAVQLLGTGLARAVKASAPEKATADPVVETAAKAKPVARNRKH